MFIKTTRSKGYEYVRMVESYWEEGTTKHRVLYNFGRLDQLQADKSFIAAIKKLCGLIEIPLLEQRENALADCSEAQMLNYGYVAYAKLWEELGIRRCLNNIQNTGKIRYDLSKSAFLMARQQLLEPRSKLSTYAHQTRYYDMEHISLQHLYRTLDRLALAKEEIEEYLYSHNHLCINDQVDVVFYDVTTFAFESVVRDELRDFGFSKDCKFHEVQVVMGLLIDSKGMPIGYELYPGNTFDAKTMAAALENLKKKFSIKRVVIVADRGLNSKGNLNKIKEAQYGYIMASRIKNMDAKTKELILNQSDYITLTKDFRYKVLPYKNVYKDENGEERVLDERLLVSWSADRARKDAADRERLISKCKKLLQNPSALKASSKRGGRKYINSDRKEGDYYLDEKKIEQDARWDGYYAIQTSEDQMGAQSVMDAYHMLWRIEDSFRVMKSTLEVRPMFHWSPRRIRGHFVLCFLSFMMERKLERMLADAATKKEDESEESQPSPERIREALQMMQLAKVTVGGDDIYIRTKNNPLGTRIFQTLHLKRPMNVSHRPELNECFTIPEKNPWGQLSFL